jgi:hypothetical protein
MAAVINPTSLPDVARLTRPVTLARDQVVPTVAALAALLPDGGLPRGSTVVVEGSGAATSLALAVAAGPSAAGAWVAVVGRPDLGLAAVVETGIAADRLALVAEPPDDQWATVVAALIGAVDVIVVGPSHRIRTGDARRLAARARERGTVLVQAGGRRAPSSAPGLDADLRLTVLESRWQGIGAGHGHLQARRLTVEATGRRRASRPRRAELWLPDAQGHVAAVAAVAAPAGVELGVDSYAGADADRLDPRIDPVREVG